VETRLRSRRTLAGAVVCALVAASLLLRPGVAIGLVVVAVLFVPLERLVPLHRQRVLRPGWRTDVVHFLADQVLVLAGIAVAVLSVGIAARVVVRVGVRDAIGAWPWLVQLVVALLVAEVGAYWGHRAAHEVPLLWRFHAIHHSSEQLDWLASARVHPIDTAFIRSCAVVPLFALGFTRATFGPLLALFTLQALLVHANVRWTFGPLRYVVATPQFHHWHHAGDPEHRNRNYSGELPILDALFGTLYLPARQWPACYGTDEPLPDSWIAQLGSPWRQ
jgi:sterol desaturase/sphingolipid hydroxylase (fatty acid hydroxylase superfamily)